MAGSTFDSGHAGLHTAKCLLYFRYKSVISDESLEVSVDLIPVLTGSTSPGSRMGAQPPESRQAYALAA